MSRPDQVLTQDPVEWGHPLNRGLLAWWLGLPHTTGGRSVFDLRRPGRGGTLTSGTQWVPGPFGFQGPRLAQASSRSMTADTVGPSVSGLTAVTVAGWWYPVSWSGSFPMLFEYSAEAYYTAGAFNAYYYAGVIYWSVNSGASFYQAGLAAPATGSWHRLAVTFDVTTTSNQVTLWTNGKLTFRGGSGTAGAFTNQTLYVGARAGSSLHFDSAFADLRIVGRAWTDAEAGLDYDQSRQGHPDTLRRIPRRSWFVPPAPATFKAAWAARSTVTLNPGALR